MFVFSIVLIRDKRTKTICVCSRASCITVGSTGGLNPNYVGKFQAENVEIKMAEETYEL